MNGAFLMSTATLTVLKKLKASTGGSYALDIDRDAVGRTTLEGYPIFQSPSMPSIASTAKIIAFGDLSRFIRRQVRNSLEIKIYRERFAELGQLAYESFLRVQGRLAKATNAPMPIRLLVCKT